MEKNKGFAIGSYIGVLIGYLAIFRLLRTTEFYEHTEIALPAGFPTGTGLLVIWALLFLLWNLGSYFVYSIPLRPRRARNIFLNSLVLVIGIYTWNFMVFSAINFAGALAVAIAVLIPLAPSLIVLVTACFIARRNAMRRSNCEAIFSATNNASISG